MNKKAIGFMDVTQFVLFSLFIIAIVVALILPATKVWGDDINPLIAHGDNTTNKDDINNLLQGRELSRNATQTCSFLDAINPLNSTCKVFG